MKVKLSPSDQAAVNTAAWLALTHDNAYFLEVTISQVNNIKLQ